MSDAALMEHRRQTGERAALQEKRSAIRGPFYRCHPDVACGVYHDAGDLRWIERAWVSEGCLFGWVCRPTAVACCAHCVMVWDGADLTLADFVAEHGP